MAQARVLVAVAASFVASIVGVLVACSAPPTSIESTGSVAQGVEGLRWRVV